MTDLYCTVCRTIADGFGPGPGGRPNVLCPRCGSLDRHRVMALLIPMMIASAPRGSTILDIAPAGGLSVRLRDLSPNTYVSLDLDPQADGREVDVRADVTRLPLRSGSVGFALCSHVLEHVVDDRAVAKELIRVLDPGGSILIQVPRRRGTATDEVLDLSPNERLERYGQPDHVRLYGDDFEERLRAVGLVVGSSSYRRLLPMPLLETIGATSDHELWVAVVDGDAAVHLDSDLVLRELAGSMLSAQPGPVSSKTPESGGWKLRRLVARSSQPTGGDQV